MPICLFLIHIRENADGLRHHYIIDVTAFDTTHNIFVTTFISACQFRPGFDVLAGYDAIFYFDRLFCWHALFHASPACPPPPAARLCHARAGDAVHGNHATTLRCHHVAAAFVYRLPHVCGDSSRFLLHPPAHIIQRHMPWLFFSS